MNRRVVDPREVVYSRVRVAKYKQTLQQVLCSGTFMRNSGVRALTEETETVIKFSTA